MSDAKLGLLYLLLVLCNTYIVATATASCKRKAGARWNGAKTSWYSLHLRLRPYIPFLKFVSLFYLCMIEHAQSVYTAESGDAHCG